MHYGLAKTDILAASTLSYLMFDMVPIHVLRRTFFVFAKKNVVEGSISTLSALSQFSFHNFAP